MSAYSDMLEGLLNNPLFSQYLTNGAKRGVPSWDAASGLSKNGGYPGWQPGMPPAPGVRGGGTYTPSGNMPMPQMRNTFDPAGVTPGGTPPVPSAGVPALGPGRPAMPGVNPNTSQGGLLPSPGAGGNGLPVGGSPPPGGVQWGPNPTMPPKMPEFPPSGGANPWALAGATALGGAGAAGLAGMGGSNAPPATGGPMMPLPPGGGPSNPMMNPNNWGPPTPTSNPSMPAVPPIPRPQPSSVPMPQPNPMHQTMGPPLMNQVLAKLMQQYQDPGVFNGLGVNSDGSGPPR